MPWIPWVEWVKNGIHGIPSLENGQEMKNVVVLSVGARLFEKKQNWEIHNLLICKNNKFENNLGFSGI